MGENYYNAREEYCKKHRIGPTEFYNLINNPSVITDEISQFRKIIQEIDEEVINLYGWENIDIQHGFHPQTHLPENDRIRFGFSEDERAKIIRLLVKCNHAEKSRQQDVSKAKPKATKTPKTITRAAAPASLFDQPPAAGLVPEKPKQAVLEVLRGGNRWFKKAEVLRESGVSEAEWNLVIAGLVADGTVERRGEKRGTEYMLRR